MIEFANDNGFSFLVGKLSSFTRAKGFNPALSTVTSQFRLKVDYYDIV
jgi:hypothetical protein